jgi:ubiquitin C-terminal hydrolase
LISSILKGDLTQVIVCGTCKNWSPQRCDDELRLPITQTAANVQDCIDAYLEPEIMSGDNMYFCEMCDKKTEARKFLEVRMDQK